MTKGGSVHTRRDWWSDWAVVLVLAIALALGWGVMTLAQGQRESYTDAASGLTVEYPRGWLVKPDDRLAFQAVDPVGAEFRTTYQVKVLPISDAAPITSTLAAILNDAALARAQEGSAYRLLDIREGPAVRGQPTMESEYAYVAKGSDLFVQQLPVVVRGMDIAAGTRDGVLLFSLLSSKDGYDHAVAAFRDFAETARPE
jgi:hypothetical protein